MLLGELSRAALEAMATVPTPPQITVRPVATTGALEFFWAAPTSDGGSAITGYTLSCSGQTPQSLGASTYSYQYTGLTDGTDYTFSITAENTIGSSTPAVYRTVQPGNKPGPVQNLIATITTSTTVTLNWSAPASNGGSAIRGYFIKAQRMNAEEAAITRSISNGESFAVLKSLTAGAVYTYSVQAVNDAGYSTVISTNPYSTASTWNLVPTFANEGQLWVAVAADISGTKIIATNGQLNTGTWGPVFRSSDSGNIWADKASVFPVNSATLSWRKIACSDDGSVIFISTQGAGSNNILRSLDYGATWSALTVVSNLWGFDIVCSSDGTKVLLSDNGVNLNVSSNTGTSWTQITSTGSRQWQSVCCSSDGQSMMAVGTNFSGFTSTNGGATWTQQAGMPSRPYTCVRCSADGTKVIACSSTGFINRSTDSGATWTDVLSLAGRSPSSGLIFIWLASSADGTKLYACTQHAIYVSRNSGTTWYLKLKYWSRFSNGFTNLHCSPDGNRVYASRYLGNIWKTGDAGETWSELATSPRSASFYAYACSADGTKQYGAELQNSFGYIWRSMNKGTTWTRNQDQTAYKSWRWVCCSADGSFVAATDSTSNAGWVWTSSDSGATWTQQTGAGQRNWRAICCDISGTKLAAVNTNTGGYIYTSADSGVTWTEQTAAGARTWRGIACSADGTKLVACVTGSGYIYTSSDYGVTWIEQTAAGLRNWGTVVCSADFTKILATVSSTGLVYLSTDSGVTWQAIAATSVCRASRKRMPSQLVMRQFARWLGVK